MTTPETASPAGTPARRRFRLTPGGVVWALLAVEAALAVGKYFGWLPPGYGVLLVFAVFGVVSLVLAAWWIAALGLRKRFQVHIREMLLYTLACAIVCAWTSMAFTNMRAQHRARYAIDYAGGSVWYDDRNGTMKCNWWNAPSSPLFGDLQTFDLFYPISRARFALPEEEKGVCVVRAGQVISLELIKHVAALRHLRSLELQGTSVDDALLEPLARLHELEKLDLRFTRVTQAGVSKLERSNPKIDIRWGWDGDFRYQHGVLCRARSYENKTIGGKGDIQDLDILDCPLFGRMDNYLMRLLKDSPRLEVLNVHPSVDDKDMKYFEGLTHLRELRFGGAGVTDASLEHLAGLKSLLLLEIRLPSSSPTGVTDEGVRKLQKALPQCEILLSPE